MLNPLCMMADGQKGIVYSGLSLLWGSDLINVRKSCIQLYLPWIFEYSLINGAGCVSAEFHSHIHTILLDVTNGCDYGIPLETRP